jgi:biopolymer transport protein TolR
MKRNNRRRNRSAIVLPEVNVIPLIDVSLMLLVVFMVTTPMLQHGIKVELPRGHSQEIKDTRQDLVVYVDKNEHFYFNESPVTFDSLIEVLKKRSGSDETVFVKADQSVPYGKVIEVVDRIKYVGGIKYVGLAINHVA